MVVFTYQSGYFGLQPGPEAFASDVGTVINGTFRQHGVFSQEGLVRMPGSLTFEEGAALNTAFVMAWAALMGGIRPLRVRDGVSVQGTGGVSVAALQIAVAAGATVVATASSPDKAELLKKLGASHVINYREDREWGATAKKLSPRAQGFSKVIEISGGESCKQSFEALARGGEIVVTGFVGSAKDGEQNGGVAFFDTILRAANIRRVQGGSRQLLEEVSQVIESRAIKPAVDPRVFELGDLKDAYQYICGTRNTLTKLSSRSHKVVEAKVTSDSGWDLESYFTCCHNGKHCQYQFSERLLISKTMSGFVTFTW